MTDKNIVESTGDAPAATRAAAGGNDPHALARKLYTTLSHFFPGRGWELRALIFGLLSGETVLLVSPPGTAKSLMAMSIAKAVGGRHFIKQLSQYTEPDEILGPLDIAAYRAGKYRRILQTDTGEVYLPLADIVYLDEVFKASTAIRNYLLQALQERIISIGATTLKVNALTFFFSSNEISYDEEDAAFYDRMVIRRFSTYTSPSILDKLILAGIEIEKNNIPHSLPTIMTRRDVENAREAINAIFYNVANQPKILEYTRALIEGLKQRNIEISDRRRIKLLRVAATIAYYYGSNTITPEDLADAARLVLVPEASRFGDVEAVIADSGLAFSTEQLKRLEAVTTELVNLVEEIEKKGDQASLNDIKALADALAKAKEELNKIEVTERNSYKIREYKEHIEAAADTIKRLMERVMPPGE